MFFFPAEACSYFYLFCEVQHYKHFTCISLSEEPYFYCYNKEGLSYYGSKPEYSRQHWIDLIAGKYNTPTSLAETSIWRMNQTNSEIPSGELGYKHPFPADYLSDIDDTLSKARFKYLF